MNVRHRDFVAALKGLPVSALQVAALGGEDGESLAVRVESSAKSVELEKRVRRALLGGMEKLKERLEDGSLRELALSLHKPGELPRNPRTGKLKSPVDERG
jgi:hypothetical protein